MYRVLHNVLIFSFSVVYCQTNTADIFFLDMGIAIEPRIGTEKTSRLIKLDSSVNDKNFVKTKKERAIYMATTSEVFTSLDKINDHISALEKSFKSQLKTLERENSRLRNQVVSLNQKLNSEIMNITYNSIIDTKPTTKVLDPTEHNLNSSDMIEADFPIDKTQNIISKSLGFDEAIYTSGVISYNHEEYDQCIKYLKTLSLKETNKRTSRNILLLLAESYEHIGRYKQALNYLTQLSKLGGAKYSDLVLLKQGIIYRKIGMNNEAHEIFKTLVNIYPNSKYISLVQDEMKNI